MCKGVDDPGRARRPPRSPSHRVSLRSLGLGPLGKAALVAPRTRTRQNQQRQTPTASAQRSSPQETQTAASNQPFWPPLHLPIPILAPPGANETVQPGPCGPSSCRGDQSQGEERPSRQEERPTRRPGGGTVQGFDWEGEELTWGLWEPLVSEPLKGCHLSIPP